MAPSRPLIVYDFVEDHRETVMTLSYELNLAGANTLDAPVMAGRIAQAAVVNLGLFRTILEE